MGASTKNFTEEVIEWYKKEGRDFPWRSKDISPYMALMTEFLLQRTRAESVERIWSDFFEKYPDLESIRADSEDDLAKFLRPLGFHNRRARDIQKTAETILEDYSGNIPDDYEELRSLPGVGIYIASATLCFGFEEKVPVADVNVKRVIEYVFDREIEKDLRKEKEMWDLLEKLLPEENYKQFNWALLDLGAKLGTGETPEFLIKFRQESN